MLDLTPYLPQLLVAWTAYIIAVASPGPAVLAIIATSIAQGRKAGLALAFGVLSGSYTWAMLTASGLSALIRTYGQAIVFLKVAGACYLFWLAYNALKAAMRGDAPKAALGVPLQMPLKKLYLKGLGIH
nr:LysE family translocator [Ensifer aridi]